MGLDKGHAAGSESGGVAHAYADERAGVEGGPEIGSTGEGRTTGHGSGATTSGATIGVGGLSAGNSGIHAGHRAALARLDAEEAAKKRPAPVVEEPVVQKPVVKEPIVEREVVREPVVQRVSEPTYTTSTTPVHISPVGDIPTEIPAGARIGHSTIISGPHNPHMEARGVDGQGLTGTPILGGSGTTHSSHSGSGLTSGLTGHNQGSNSGSGSGYRQGEQPDSSNQPGMVSKLASAVGLGGQSGGQSGSNQQSGNNQGSSGYGRGSSSYGTGSSGMNQGSSDYNQGSTGYGSGSSGLMSGQNTDRSTEYSQGSNPPYGVQAGNVSSPATYGTQGSTGHASTGGHGVNDNTNYGGNSSSGGVTDAQGNQLSGNPAAGTDGSRIGGSFGQSETMRSGGPSR